MNYCRIQERDGESGPGIRVSLHVSGCRLHCPGCNARDMWDFKAGKPFNEKAQKKVIHELNRAYCRGLTVTGGEPMEPENQKDLAFFLQKVRKNCPCIDIWIYTGYILDKDLLPGQPKHTEYTDQIICAADVIVDGPYMEALQDVKLEFRETSNQRIIRKSGG